LFEKFEDSLECFEEYEDQYDRFDWKNGEWQVSG
jgi:hypothetical protein